MAKKNKNVESAEVAENTAAKDVGAKKGASTNGADYKYVIQNQKVRRAAKHKKVITVIGVSLLIVFAGVGIFYGAYTAVEINSFKVFVDSSGSKVLSLSSKSDFLYGTEQLEISGPSVMDNTTLAKGKNLVDTSAVEDRLPEILSQDGFGGADDDRFIAATFYLKNVTPDEQIYNEVLNLRSSTLNIETAIRVMLIRKRSDTPDYEVVVYAKYDVDEQGNTVQVEVVPLTKTKYTPFTITTVTDNEGKEAVKIEHYGTEPWIAEDFFSAEYIFYNKGLTLAPQEIIKYGIIIWLEGWDKDCVDDKLSGTIRMDFAFEQNG